MSDQAGSITGDLQQRIVRKLERDLGPLLTHLQNPTTIEILANPDGRVWVERLGQPMQCIGSIRRSQAEAIIRTVAGDLGLEATADHPLIEGELAIDGSRFAGQLPPVVSAPAFAIRKRAIAIYSLDDYLESGAMARSQHAQIIQAIHQHKNIIISGGTGSGKTTFLNALISAIVDSHPDERVVIIEDTSEIQCTAENSVTYRTSTGINLTQLVRATLRMRPDRVLVGEVRGPEALDLLDIWGTGHPGGVATVHANDANHALARLGSLVGRHPQAPREISALIQDTVDLVVHMARHQGRRCVRQVLGVAPAARV